MEGTESKETKQEEEKKASVPEVIPCVELEADVIAGALSSVIRYVSSPKNRYSEKKLLYSALPTLNDFVGNISFCCEP